MSDEEEYEIESILEARVENASRKGRKTKLTWKFRVRWKGYSPEDDTWEPIENMTGSEETIEHFWKRTNTNGRDYRNMKQFSEGEVFMPVGPPKREKGKNKEQPLLRDTAQEAVNAISRPARQSRSRVRKRDDDEGETDTNEEHSPKRPRATRQQFSSKPNLLLTEAGSPSKVKPADISLRENPSQERPSDVEPQLNIEAELPNLTNDNSLITKEPSPPIKHVQSTVSSRRTRYVNPLVQILQEYHASNVDPGSNKSNGTSPQASPKARRRSKPGPGRSSDGLLIQSISRNENTEKLRSDKARKPGMRDRSVDEVAEMVLDAGPPLNPPVPQDLSQSDDVSFTSTTSPDHQNQEMSPVKDPVPESGKGGLNSVVGNSLFPTTTGKIENTAWTRSTIFGPLGLGSDAPLHVTNEDRDDVSMPFQVCLDPSVSMPIILADTISSPILPKSTLSRGGPPGKFYRGRYAVELLGTLRIKGSFARAILSPEATEVDRLNFWHFMKRLTGEELFLAPVGGDLLVFCSSTNALSTQKLDIPPNLASTEAMLVSQVSIENYSDFASAANHADNVMWSQYILSVSDGAP